MHKGQRQKSTLSLFAKSSAEEADLLLESQPPAPRNFSLAIFDKKPRSPSPPAPRPPTLTRLPSADPPAHLSVSRQFTASSGSPLTRNNTYTVKRDIEEASAVDAVRARYEQILDVEEQDIPARVFDLNSTAELDRFLASAEERRVLCVATDMFVPSFAFLDQVQALLRDAGFTLKTANFDAEDIQERYRELEIPATIFLGRELTVEGCDFDEFRRRFEEAFGAGAAPPRRASH